jgi:DNA-binding transcriptional MerR regulator
MTVQDVANSLNVNVNYIVYYQKEFSLQRFVQEGQALYSELDIPLYSDIYMLKEIHKLSHNDIQYFINEKYTNKSQPHLEVSSFAVAVKNNNIKAEEAQVTKEITTPNDLLEGLKNHITEVAITQNSEVNNKIDKLMSYLSNFESINKSFINNVENNLELLSSNNEITSKNIEDILKSNQELIELLRQQNKQLSNELNEVKSNIIQKINEETAERTKNSELYMSLERNKRKEIDEIKK